VLSAPKEGSFIISDPIAAKRNHNRETLFGADLNRRNINVIVEPDH
jgi:hypothetical protein